MKTFSLIFIACLLSSCGEDKKGTSDSSKQSAPPSASAVPESADKSADARPAPYVAGDSVPPMEILGEGKFSLRGMADAFQQSVGWAPPEYVTPLEGDYKVWNERDFVGQNRSNCGVRFAVPSEKMKELADAIEKTWRVKYGGNSKFKIHRETSTNAGLDFPAGTIFLSTYNLYSSYTLDSFQIYLDPVAGKMWLGIYRGTQDDPLTDY